MSCRTDQNLVTISAEGTARLIDNQLWSVNRLAEYLDVPPATIRDWRHKRKIPYCKVGRHIRFVPSDIEEWLKQRSVRCRLLERRGALASVGTGAIPYCQCP